MGKISDALEMKAREKSLKARMVSTKRTENLVKEGPKPHIKREVTVQNRVINPKLLAHYARESLDAENFKILKGQILFPKNGRKPKTIMITSAFPGEGKTFVAANLAVSIAQGIHEHALLVDCDFRHPDLHNMLGYSNKEGLKEYLSGNSELPDLLIQTWIDKLSLLTAGSPSANPSELLSSNMMKEFFEEVKGRYQDRYIIIDSAPSRIVSEVSVLAKYVDGIIFVVMAQKSPREIIETCIETIGKEKVLGIVFNGYSKGEKTYDSYYKNYYKK